MLFVPAIDGNPDEFAPELTVVNRHAPLGERRLAKPLSHRDDDVPPALMGFLFAKEKTVVTLIRFRSLDGFEVNRVLADELAASVSITFNQSGVKAAFGVVDEAFWGFWGLF
jgi:hypothetical protein